MRAAWHLLAVLVLVTGCGPTGSDSGDYWIDDAGNYHRQDSGPQHCDPVGNPADCDQDEDGYTPAQGDCDDQDATRYPGASECKGDGNGDGLDNNCNQYVDEGCMDTDADADGYTRAQGDCTDSDPLINPGAYEVAGNGKDDNCDGRIDEAIDCDCNTVLNPSEPQAYLDAMEMCATVVDEKAFIGDARAITIKSSFGVYQPRVPTSCNLLILSTGAAGSTMPQEGTPFNMLTPHQGNPAKYPENPGYQYEPDEVYDYAELRLKLRVPMNAKSFAFDFVYLTSEYPEWSCTEFNDTFLAMLKSQSYTGNISFDSQGNTIQVNSALFTEVDPSQTAGTGYDASSSSCDSSGGRAGCTLPTVGMTCPIGGSTGWLTTTSPVTAGEQIDLSFIIFDEGDAILDSTVLIDNFRWDITGSTGPCTDPDGCID